MIFQISRLMKSFFKSQGGYNVLSYPSSDKNNKLSISSSGNCFAISEKCDNKEGAWSFLRRLYTYEFQKAGMEFGGLPVRQDVMDKKIEYAMATKAYKDDDGTQVTPIDDSYTIDSFTVNIKPYTKAHMDLFRTIVGRIGKESNYDTYFNDIFNGTRRSISIICWLSFSYAKIFNTVQIH